MDRKDAKRWYPGNSCSPAMCGASSNSYQCGLYKGKTMLMWLVQWVLSNEAEHDCAKSAVSHTLQTLFAEIATLLTARGSHIEEFECKTETEWNKQSSKI